MATGIFFAIFFIFWMFFVSSFFYGLCRLGETASFDIITAYPRLFYYRSWIKRIFKGREADILFFSTSLTNTLGKLGFALASATIGYFLLPLSAAKLILLGLVFIFLVLFFSDFCPRLWALFKPESALRVSLGYSSFFLFLSFPFSFLFLKFNDFLSKKLRKKGPTDPIEEMKTTIVQILKDADIKEKLNAFDKKLIESVVKFKDRIVREVMIPRVNLFCLTAETPIREAAKELVKESYSRIPVYKDNIDNIRGVLMFKDILQLYMDCAEGKQDISQLNASIDTIIKGVFYTPETKRASLLLQEFRVKQMHMAIVVDEYGGTEGIVTMEDILEEIVGEIADEYDVDEELLYTTAPSGGWIVDARMSILDAEEIFGIYIPQEGDYDTIGGYIFHKMGSIPEKGLKIHHDDFDLEILSSSERSVEKIRITRRQKGV